MQGRTDQFSNSSKTGVDYPLLIYISAFILGADVFMSEWIEMDF